MLPEQRAVADALRVLLQALGFSVHSIEFGRYSETDCTVDLTLSDAFVQAAQAAAESAAEGRSP